MSRYFIAYEDDGPAGMCGQEMRITSPWRILYEYDDRDDALAFYRYLRANRLDPVDTVGRRKPRAVGFWSDDPIYGRVEPGPIVPVDKRDNKPRVYPSGEAVSRRS